MGGVVHLEKNEIKWIETAKKIGISPKSVEKEMIGITDSRLLHMRGVAEFMYNTCKDNGMSEEKAKEMYMLGFVHDIGYRFTPTDEKESHPIIGAEMLKEIMTERMQTAIRYHGKLPESVPGLCEIWELDLLNWADLNVNHVGQNVGYEKRLEELKERYGEDSTQYRNSCAILRHLEGIYKKRIR